MAETQEGGQWKPVTFDAPFTRRRYKKPARLTESPGDLAGKEDWFRRTRLKNWPWDRSVAGTRKLVKEWAP